MLHRLGSSGRGSELRPTEQLDSAFRRRSRDQKFPFGLRQVGKGLRDIASTPEIINRAAQRHHNGIRSAGDNASATKPDAVARLFMKRPDFYSSFSLAKAFIVRSKLRERIAGVFRVGIHDGPLGQEFSLPVVRVSWYGMSVLLPALPVLAKERSKAPRRRSSDNSSSPAP